MVEASGLLPATTRKRQPLRRRLALLSAASVAVVAGSLGLVAYLVVADTLRSGVDAELATTSVGRGNSMGGGSPMSRAQLLANPERLCEPSSRPTMMSFQTTVGLVQVVRADGTVCGTDAEALVSPSEAELAMAAGGAQAENRDTYTASGTHVRVAAVEAADGYVVLVGRDLTGVDIALRKIAAALGFATVAGVLVAGVAGQAVARAGLRPVDQLTATTEHIAATLDLTTPIDVSGDDEVARLARAFNAMTDALARARVQQQQLIADASHELRTPLTSLRTNLELLARSESTGVALPPAERRALLDSVIAQVSELGDLSRELTTLSRDQQTHSWGPVRLDEVARTAIERVARRGEHLWAVELEPWHLGGDPASLERAVVNLLDNAVKFAPKGSEISVHLAGGRLSVADHGPGVPGEDRERAFDRFWRSESARSRPGSGLGLAIVADAAARHGGRAWIGETPGGGATVHLQLPGTRV